MSGGWLTHVKLSQDEMQARLPTPASKVKRTTKKERNTSLTEKFPLGSEWTTPFGRSVVHTLAIIESLRNPTCTKFSSQIKRYQATVTDCHRLYRLIALRHEIRSYRISKSAGAFFSIYSHLEFICDERWEVKQVKYRHWRKSRAEISWVPKDTQPSIVMKNSFQDGLGDSCLTVDKKRYNFSQERKAFFYVVKSWQIIK